MSKPKIVNKLSDHGYPISSRHYKTAHREASEKEKEKYPSGYEKLKNLEHKLGKHEMMATNKRSGKIEIEKKFKKYKSELAYHEKEEHKKLREIELRKKGLNK